HMLQTAQIAGVREEKQPVMKAVVAGADELRDLIAYLARLNGPNKGIAPANPVSGGLDFSRIQKPRPGDWLTYNGTLDGNRYSELKQINAGNVATLGVKWIFPVDHFGLEVTPLVADGVMYLTGPNQAIALDAATGRQIWKYSRARTQGLIG